MKSKLLWLIVAVVILLFGCGDNQKDIVEYVNPFIGTSGDGHTFPGASLPFGMVQLSPDTRLEGQPSCGGYYYPDKTILGFSHTHLNGVGEPELRDVLFMPTEGEVSIDPGSEDNPESDYRSRYNHDSEIAQAGYYSVILDDYNIKVELTATERCGFHKYTFPNSDNSHIIIDLAHPNGAEELVIKKVRDDEIEGLRRSHGWAFDQYVYFVAKFSKPFNDFNIVVDDKIIEDISEAKGNNIKAVITYSTESVEPILVKVGISAVSTDGARENLKAEIKDWNFDNIKITAKEKWNKELKKIVVEGGTEEQRTIFYTSMYHASLSPILFMDVDVKYRGVDHKIHTANGFKNYSVFSLWDTFRGVHPLMTIINQNRTNEFIKSLLAKYDDGGKLPMWPLVGNYTDDMLGYHAVPVIVDAYMKGIRDYNVEKAYKAIKEISQMDRLGLKYYKNIGYLPYDKQGESVSKTLEYCYDDWCISQMAKSLNNVKDYEYYNVRSHFYENVFDTSTNFMRGRSLYRNWLSPFDPLLNSAYSEGNAYQYMFVPHDADGLINLVGGDEKFSDWLDVLFTYKTEFDQQGIIGQYWHGNEPGHHLPYLYNYVGKPWKTQELVYKILTELYSDAPDGIAGNEDCGQMSAWYILSSMGFYSVAPGQDIYVIGTPLFKEVTINLENGKKFAIEAKNISVKNIYIQLAELNGRVYTKSFINHSDIVNGGKLIFTMGDKPNKNWGSLKEDRPSSGNGGGVTSLPYVLSGETLFEDSTRIELNADKDNSVIYYTVNASEPTVESTLYTSPLLFTESTLLKFRAFNDELLPSGIVETKISKAAYADPVENIKVKKGLVFDYYEKFFVTTADLDIEKPILHGVTINFNIKNAKRDNYFGFKFTGYIKVPTDGIYTFFLESNDGSRLYINDVEIIENDANHASITQTGQVGLKSGLHKIDLKYFQCGGGKELKVSWQGSKFKKREIRSNKLYRKIN